MRNARKLLLLTAMALTAMAMTATPASAQLEVHAEEPDSPQCGTVTEVAHHQVTGGCHIEFAGTVDIPLHAYVPGKVTLFSCEWYMEGQVGENGAGYVTEAVLDPPDGPAGPGCTRTPCDESATAGEGAHQELLWPFQIIEDAPGEEEVRLEFCFRPVTTPEGSSGNWCELHLEFTQIAGEHNYEIGHIDPDGTPTEVFCANNPGAGYTGPHSILPAPTSFEPHFDTTGLRPDDTPIQEKVEVIHDVE